ncbi:MAG: Crp/Fnr family transcriptional regulator, partial [Saprospiraceae bacterium]|nr:Crp/Fnr family transcriptional regulator [Saprospiraceae bacterium]
MDNSQVFEVINQNYFFSGLPAPIIGEIALGARKKIYEKDEIVFFEGEPCQGLHILQSGMVKLYRQAPNGRELIIKVLEGGASFNEVPVFDSGTNPVNVAAMERSEIWIVDSQIIRQILISYPNVALIILGKLARNLRSLIQMAEELAFFQVTHRLARLIKQQMIDFPERGKIFRIPQDELASRLGTVREVVTRALGEL